MRPKNLDWEAYGKHLKPVGPFFKECLRLIRWG